MVKQIIKLDIIQNHVAVRGSIASQTREEEPDLLTQQSLQSTDESVTNDYMEPYPGELPASQVSLDEMNTAFLVTPDSSFCFETE